MKLSTERLIISTIGKNDVEFIFNLTNTSGWLKYIGNGNIKSNSQAKTYIEAIIQNPNINYWVVRLKDSRNPIGIVTFIKKKHLNHPDFGFAFLPEFCNRGYAEEASRRVLNQLASESKFTTVLAVTTPANERSINLLNKLGLSYSHDIGVNQQSLNVFQASSDLILINEICRRFFHVFNNTNRKTIHLDILKTICVPEIMIYAKQAEHYAVSNLSDFIAVRQKILTDGTLVRFQEKEVISNTIILGNIAQRQSKYLKSGELKGKHFSQNGLKLMQFIKTGNSWSICSILWEDDRAD